MKTYLVWIAILLIAIVIGSYFFMHKTVYAPGGEATTTPTNPSAPQAASVTTPQGITFSYADPYGLATTPDQVLVKSYIPSCDEGFAYCLYRSGTEFANTNFESAGVALRPRADLKSKSACLTTQPSGFSNLHATTSDQSGYSTSVIGPIGDAGAGHYASGSEYRLWFGTTCYQFDTRIGETQFANYPAGTKTLFTDANRTAVMSELRSVLDSVMLGGVKVLFPQA